ncbi:D-beta-hydroxybutyrate dehydrogenase-like isoform X3 [Haliotis cracherodii]|uniref:D-beta-hydroxybutyrate dehydrogenase-like isoform X3 n=1 Tax=Haliotis cracherodii TaxID=6455 RepID=UPI0039EB8FFE
MCNPLISVTYMCKAALTEVPADMDGKVALVTGSTTGIGLGIANHLAEKGCSIILTGLGSQELINSILEDFKKYKGRVDYVPADLIDPVSIATFCDKVCDIHPDGVDILVNNAGIQYVRAVEDYPLEKWNEMIAITMTAPFLLTKHFLSRMKQKGWGRIINMSSQMAVISTQGKAPYSAAKAGLVGFTKWLFGRWMICPEKRGSVSRLRGNISPTRTQLRKLLLWPRYAALWISCAHRQQTT